MQLDERSPEYPAVTKENSEIKGEDLLNDYKKKTVRARKKMSPVNFLNESDSDGEREKIQILLNIFVVQMRLKMMLSINI